MRPSAESRHLSWEAFEERIRSGTPSIERIAGHPRVDAVIDAGGARVGVRIHGLTTALPTSPLSEITIHHGKAEGGAFVDVATSNPDLFPDFYAFCCAVADRVQLDQRGPEDAISETLAAWAALLRRIALLSEEHQVGLIGELWFLREVAARLGWAAALDAWKGPRSEEHDFVLPLVDVEVKTTTKERRVHQIGSLKQLEPKLNRPLFILSVQLTAASAAAGGMALPGWIAQIEGEAQAAERGLSGILHRQLFTRGWRPEHSLHYLSSFALRSEATAVPVDERCPAVVSAVLAGLGADRLARLERVSYGINLEGLGILSTHHEFSPLLFGVKG